MAFLDSAQFDQNSKSPLVWEALMAHLDKGRIEINRRPLAPSEAPHLQHVQRMLLAATLASGTIVMVAAVMMLGLL